MQCKIKLFPYIKDKDVGNTQTLVEIYLKAVKTLKQEIIILLIGAGIGFLLSILTTITNNAMNKTGKLKIYYKIVFKKGSSNTWGFFKGDGGMFFQVPIWIEVHNASNIAKVIRDFNLILFKDGSRKHKMTQINNQELKNEDLEWYGNQGSYSFVVEPLSIKKFELLFFLKQSDMSDNYEFDEVRFIYFNGKGKEQIKKLSKIKEPWNPGNIPRTSDWQFLK